MKRLICYALAGLMALEPWGVLAAEAALGEQVQQGRNSGMEGGRESAEDSVSGGDGRSVSQGDGETVSMGNITLSGGDAGMGIYLTELYPNDVDRNSTYGCGSSEIFEYVEVYNPSQSPVNFVNNYSVYYEYTGKEKPLAVADFNGGEVIIPAKGCAVFWSYREDITYTLKTPAVEDFREEFQIPQDVPVYKLSGQNGMASADRGLRIQTNTGTASSHYFFTGADVSDGTSVELSVPDNGADMGAYRQKTEPNPGVIHNGQLGRFAQVQAAPEWTCDQPVTMVDEGMNLEVPYSYTGEAEKITLFYKTSAMKEYASRETAVTENSGKYTVSIGADVIGQSRWVEYYLVAENSSGTGEAPKVRVKVKRLFGPAPGSDLRVQELTITEIFPNDISRDSVYGSGANDLMEYLEITNPTDQDIVFGDGYRLMYCYPSGNVIKEKELTLKTMEGGTDIVIPANGSAVLWCDRREYTALYKTFPTEQEFRDAFDIPSGVPVYMMTGQNGIGNTDRGFDLYYQEESISYFYWGTDDTADGKSVNLRANALSNEMLVLGRKQSPSAGVYTQTQITYVPDFRTSPVLTLLEEKESVPEGNIIRIPYSYEDPAGVVQIDLYYKTSLDTDYQVVETTSFAIAGKYYVLIPSDATVGAEYVDYYLCASNAYRSSVTEPKRILVERRDAGEGIRVNIHEGQLLSGQADLVARDLSDSTALPGMFLDGQELETVPAIEQGVYFTFRYAGVDSYFKNALTAGEEIIKTFSKCSEIPADSSMAIPVSRTYFTYHEDGTATVNLQLRAGTWGSPFESGTDANQDDFTVWNLYLKLSDGTLVGPDNITDPKGVVKMGDSAGCKEVLEMQFTIPAGEDLAACAKVDTASLNDGRHVLAVKGSQDKEIMFFTDNTAPTVELNVENGEKIQGIYTIEANVTDISETQVTGYLDGAELIPAGTHSWILDSARFAQGEHTLLVAAADAAGNLTEKTVVLQTAEADNTLGGITVLETKNHSAKLEIPVSGDGMVSIYAGRKLEVGDEITVWEGQGDNTLEAVKKGNGTVTASANGEYPYQILEIDTAGFTSSDTDAQVVRLEMNVMLSYNGEVCVYVENAGEAGWDKLDAVERGDKVTVEFALKDHVKDGKARVLVQGRGEGSGPDGARAAAEASAAAQWDGTGIPENYDFSFAWITDTQYYSETWNDNFYQMNQWILDQRESQKIEYVIHTGDIVDEFNEEGQFQVADRAMKMLDDAGLPYGVLGGNHDVAHGNQRYDLYWKYFGENRFADSPVYGGSYNNNLGHYDLLNVNGEEMVFIYMSWDIYEKELAWINNVLGQYPDRKAVICVHGGIDASGTESYTSKLLLDEVCKKNPNVFAILNGHYHGASINIEGFDDDGDGVKERKVYQICTDYQSASEGGMGYVKMLYFDLENDKIYMNSYSSKLNDFNYYDTPKLDSYEIGLVEKDIDIYELDVDFDRSPKSITVDQIKGGLYGEQPITQAQAAQGKALLEMFNLVEGQSYGIYGKKLDSNGNVSYTQILEFIFKNQTLVPDEDEGNNGDNGNSGNGNNGSGSQNGAADSGSESNIVIDWDQAAVQVNDKVKLLAEGKAAAGTVLDLVTGENTIVPSKILEMIRGRNLTLALHNGRGVAFSINGLQLTQNILKDITSLDLTTATGKETEGAPAAVRNAEGVLSVKRITMGGQEALKIPVNMHVALGAENAGHYANLYRYDPAGGKTEYITSYTVTAAGQAMFALQTSSDYLVTVTADKPGNQSGGQYVVRKGDTLNGIARKLGINQSQITGWNPQMKDRNKIYTGQKLTIR